MGREARGNKERGEEGGLRKEERDREKRERDRRELRRQFEV